MIKVAKRVAEKLMAQSIQTDPKTGRKNLIINMCFKPRVIVESWKINTRLNSMFNSRNSKSTEERELKLKQEEQEQ